MAVHENLPANSRKPQARDLQIPSYIFMIFDRKNTGNLKKKSALYLFPKGKRGIINFV